MIPGITYEEIMPLVIFFMGNFGFLIALFIAITVIAVILRVVIGLARD